MKFGVDCREIQRNKYSSLSLILFHILEYFKGKEDVQIFIFTCNGKLNMEYEEYFYTDNRVNGGISLVKYQYWMAKKADELKLDYLFQINHYVYKKPQYTKVINTIHDLYDISGIEKTSLKRKLLYMLSLKLAIRNSYHIFTPSKFTLNQAVRKFGSANKFSVNYNGIDDVMEVINPPIIDGDYFLFIGRISYWKGTLELIQRFLREFVDTKMKLVVVGKYQNSDIEHKVQELVQGNNRIIILSGISEEEKGNLYHYCKWFIYPSRYDGFGLPVLEAAKYKVPVLINDIDVLREITQNLGMYFNFYQENSMRLCIKQTSTRMINDNIEQMVKIAGQYKWDKYCELIYNFLKDDYYAKK